MYSFISSANNLLAYLFTTKKIQNIYKNTYEMQMNGNDIFRLVWHIISYYYKKQ